MSKNSSDMHPPYTDLAQLDAHRIIEEEYEELPELTDAMLARGTWRIGGQQVSREQGEDAFRMTARQGRTTNRLPKTAVKIRYDQAVITAFRATGKGWQTRMNNVLREYVRAHPPT